jgi:hypothetical protein
MKSKLTILIISLMALGVMARVHDTFHGWDYLKNMSDYIAVVQCGNPIPQKPNVRVVGAGKSDVEIQVIFTLKGTNNASPLRLQTQRDLYQGQNYLVFGYCGDGVYSAYEEYRVVLLDELFSTNLIAGKTLDEQIQILLERRLII